jgi:hypothetical protein
LGSLTLTTDELWSSALVWVRLTMYSRGKPSSGAMIFSVDDREARQWRAAVATKEILQEIEARLFFSFLVKFADVCISLGSWPLRRPPCAAMSHREVFLLHRVKPMLLVQSRLQSISGCCSRHNGELTYDYNHDECG